MFAEAYKKGAAFTRPVVISAVTGAGQCFSSIGTFVHLNNEGWIATAAHILTMAEQWLPQVASVRAAESQIAELSSSPEGTPQADDLRVAIAGQIKKFSYWWAYDRVQLVEVAMNLEADIAIGRLSPFDPSWVAAYPDIKDPAQGVDCGTSVCRLGYAFNDLAPQWDGSNFLLPDEVYTMPRFPNEGIITRHVLVGSHPVGYNVGFLETSTPGLRGQSGGPIFDQHGTVWAIQSKTMHLPLGFSPAVPGNPGQVEHQFLNVGWGTHPETLVGLLRERGVSFNMSSY